MKRFLLTFGAAALLAVLAPAAALAQRHHQHSRTHHARTHHTRLRRIGDVSTTSTSPTTTPTTTPSPAATVTSFTAGTTPGTGTLTITPTGGSPITGMVTPDTELVCVSASQSQGDDDQGDQGDQSSGSGDQGDQGDQSSGSGDQGDQGDQSSSGGDQGDEGSTGGDEGTSSSSSCSTANLASMPPVLGAELAITSTGATWEKVVLSTP